MLARITITTVRSGDITFRGYIQWKLFIYYPHQVLKAFLNSEKLYE